MDTETSTVNCKITDDSSESKANKVRRLNTNGGLHQKPGASGKKIPKLDCKLDLKKLDTYVPDVENELVIENFHLAC